MSTLEAVAGVSARMTPPGLDVESNPSGTHLCMIYNDERERLWAMSRYIQSRQAPGGDVSHLVDTMPPENLKRSMRALGMTLLDELDGRQYSSPQADETCCPDRTFSVEPMIDTVGQARYLSIQEGYAGARLTGEMTWSKRGHAGSENLAEYECALNIAVPAAATTAVGQCGAQRFNGARLYDIVRVDPMMIVHGQVVKNPYYVEAEEFLVNLATPVRS